SGDSVSDEQILCQLMPILARQDTHTIDHCDRVAKLVQALGTYLDLSDRDIRVLVWGAYLHDIGKVTTPDHILLKRGKLSAAEFDIMREHVIAGEQLCQPLSTLSAVLPIIRHHHERWNGSGYPDGLAGYEIPFLVQVFQLVDIYDALTSKRPYKSAYSPAETLRIMVAEADRGWYNPVLMETFCAFVRQLTSGLQSRPQPVSVWL
ncbi:MAG: HD domain-containing phosphohydrolase, partial [Cyanobacteria bacterium J06554_3]